MITPGLALDIYDLDRLDSYLSSSEFGDELMMLSELDGYLTAVCLAPHAIPPSEWLPQIWGGEAPAPVVPMPEGMS